MTEQEQPRKFASLEDYIEFLMDDLGLPLPVYSVPRKLLELFTSTKPSMINNRDGLLVLPNDEGQKITQEQLQKDYDRSGAFGTNRKTKYYEQGKKLKDRTLSQAEIDTSNAHWEEYRQDWLRFFTGNVSQLNSIRKTDNQHNDKPSKNSIDNMLGFSILSDEVAITAVEIAGKQYMVLVENDPVITNASSASQTSLSRFKHEKYNCTIVTVLRYEESISCFVLEHILASSKTPENILEQLERNDDSNYDDIKNATNTGADLKAKSLKFWQLKASINEDKKKNFLSNNKNKRKVVYPLIELIDALLSENPEMKINGLYDLIDAAEDRPAEGKDLKSCLNKVIVSLAQTYTGPSGRQVSTLVFGVVLMLASVLLGIDAFSEFDITGLDYKNVDDEDVAAAMSLTATAGAITTGYAYTVAPKHKLAADEALKKARDTYDEVTKSHNAPDKGTSPNK